MENICQLYTGVNGNVYTAIEPALGKGGEGSVHEILGNPLCVLKIFNEKNRSDQKHEKLIAMINTPLSMKALQQITWPMDVLYDDSSNFVGYVMPKLKDDENSERLNLISYGCVECTLDKKISIAKNLCCALAALHDSEVICGDFNPANIIVNKRTGLVNLIDTDSYCIRDKNSGKVYRCEVGMPEYIAKELQEKLKRNKGEDLRTLPWPTFTKETDLFALAVHIFALLMNGCHPFACALDNNADNIKQLSYSQTSIAAPQPIENIRNGFFPFYMKKQHITTPLYAPNFDFLPENLKEMFIRAFTMNPCDRPSAEKWFHELDKSLKRLTICKNNKEHIHFNHKDTCFFCELEKQEEHSHELVKNSIATPNLYLCEPYKACVLLLDISASMDGEKIHCLNAGVMKFLSQVTTDELTNKRVDLSIIVFNDSVEIVQDFTPVCKSALPILKATGEKNVAKAINMAIDKVLDRQHFYHSIGISCFPPEIIMFTDGLFTDDISQVSERIKSMEKQDKLSFSSIVVPEYDLNKLANLSDGKRIIELKNYDFTGFLIGQVMTMVLV